MTIITQVEIFRTPQGHLKVAFVKYIDDKKKVEETVDFERFKSIQKLEATCHVFGITGNVPHDMLTAL